MKKYECLRGYIKGHHQYLGVCHAAIDLLSSTNSHCDKFNMNSEQGEVFNSLCTLSYNQELKNNCNTIAAFFASNRSIALFAEIELEIKYRNACITFGIEFGGISFSLTYLCLS